MRPRGMFSLLLVLLFLILQPYEQEWENTASRNGNMAVAQAMEMEFLNARRYELEEGLDHFLEQQILLEAAQGNLESGLLREKLAGEMAAFMRNTEQETGPGIHYFILNSAGKKEDISVEKMSSITRVVVQHLRGPFYLVEFSVTSGIFRNQTMVGEISGQQFRNEFRVPAGYRKVMVVAGPGYA